MTDGQPAQDRDPELPEPITQHIDGGPRVVRAAVDEPSDRDACYAVDRECQARVVVLIS